MADGSARGTLFRHKYRDVDRYQSEQDDELDEEAGKPTTSGQSVTATLVKSSLERQAAMAAAATPKARSSAAPAISHQSRPDPPGDATKESSSPVLKNPTTTTRAARMKKLQRRRERITVVQNPRKSPRSSPPKSSPPKPPKSSPTKSTPSKSGTPSPAKSSNKSSPQKEREFRERVKRERVAGGAAAKLMLTGPRKDDEEEIEERSSYESNETGTSGEAEFTVDIDEYSHATEELDDIRRKVRVEYDIGTAKNKRYRAISDDSDDYEDSKTEASLPSILDRSEVFHENASAAIMALLNPPRTIQQNDGINECSSVVSGYSALSGPSTLSARGSTLSAQAGESTLSPSRSIVGSVSPRRTLPKPRSKLDAANNISSTVKEVSAVSALDAPNVVVQKIPNQPLLSPTAEQKLELMKKKMIDPSKTLADLLTAVATPEDGGEMDQAYMVRRKNACGALKVLSANAANRRTIAWTIGVLPALASVLHDGGDGTIEEAFPDVRVRDEYIESRKRAVAALLNLSLPKENRIPIFHCPGLVHGLAKTIIQDTEESRQGCSAILGYLAKTPENRLLLVKAPLVLDSMNTAIKPWTPPELDSPEKVKKYVWDSMSESFSASTVTGPVNSGTTMESPGATTTSGDFESTTADYSNRLDDDSDLTPQMSSSPTKSLASKRSYLYDNDPNKFVQPTRQNVFATLLHVVKEKDNAFHLSRHPDLLFTLIDISYMHDSPSHIHAVKIICNLTRHRGNSKLLVFNNRMVVPAMVHAMGSPSVVTRTHACRTLQNLAQDKSCRQSIAITKNLVESLVHRVRLATDQDEKLAAVCALKNLSDEPTNLIPMSNTPECFATLMQIAHGQEGNTTEMMQFQACDALATLSHFLRKIASTGTAEPGPNGEKVSEMMNPTLQVVTWSQWT